MGHDSYGHNRINIYKPENCIFDIWVMSPIDIIELISIDYNAYKKILDNEG